MDFYPSGDGTYYWKCVSICFWLFKFYSRAPKRRRARGNFPFTLPFDGHGCVNNAL